METSLFERDGKTWTRFKLTLKSYQKWKSVLRCMYQVDTDYPVEENRGYIYFEKEGDWASVG